MADDRINGANTKPEREPGTFQPGNPGRPCGARNKATLAALALLEGEAEAITRKTIELAKAGDTVALKLALDRLLAKGRRGRGPARGRSPWRGSSAPRPRSDGEERHQLEHGALREHPTHQRGGERSQVRSPPGRQRRSRADRACTGFGR